MTRTRHLPKSAPPTITHSPDVTQLCGVLARIVRRIAIEDAQKTQTQPPTARH